MGAAIGPCDRGLLIRAHCADHGDTERAGPLAGDQADAAGRSVIENGLAALQRVDLPEQVLRRHALHHQRRGGTVRNAVRQRDEHVGRHDTDVRIGALRSEQIADAIAGLDVGYPRSNRFDHADSVGAEAVRQRQRVTSGTKVNVDEIDGDIGVTHPRFARSGLTDLDLLQAKYFRTADLIEANCSSHDETSCYAVISCFSQQGEADISSSLIRLSA